MNRSAITSDDMLKDPSDLYRMGDRYQRKGDLDKAISCYERAVELKFDFVEAHFKLAVLLANDGQLARASRVYKTCIQIEPRLGAAYNNLGLILKTKGNADAAISCFRKCIDVSPEFFQAYNNLGTVYKAFGQLGPALETYLEGIRIAPENAIMHYNLGMLRQDLGQLDAALASFEQAAAVRPGFSQALNNAGIVLKKLGRTKEGIGFFENAVDADHTNAEANYNLGKLLLDLCHWGKIDPVLDRIDRQTRQAISTGGKPAEEPCFNLARSQDLSLNYRVARSHSKEIESRVPQTKIRRPLGTRSNIPERLTVGYLSDSFKNHPTAHLIYDVFRLHDRDRVSVHCYSYGRDDRSAYRKEIEAGSDQFIDISDLTPDQAADRIHDNQVDILIDLKGHTYSSRLDICAARPAPVQVRYLGMAGTTGASFFDYIVTDAVVTPLDHEAYYSEKLVHMPHTYQMNSPKAMASEARYKNKSLIKIPERGTVPEHLARLSLADLCLDTRVVNGAATTSDALWAGVPVVTVKGGHFASRMSASILSAVGLPELITDDLRQYEKLVVALASDGDRLKALREKLKHNKHTHPLFDTRRFVRNLENAFEQMWDIYRAGEPPRHIQVKDCGPSADMQDL